MGGLGGAGAFSGTARVGRAKRRRLTEVAARIRGAYPSVSGVRARLAAAGASLRIRRPQAGASFEHRHEAVDDPDGETSAAWPAAIAPIP